MSLGALKKLTIEHLRGCVVPFSLTFEKGKKLTVVYGENGTGKSTICDALEFLGRGRVGSIENRGLGKTSRYWPALGKGLGDVAVTLETGTGSCRATIGRTEVIVSSPEHRPKVEVLRRAQILSLLEAKPGDRYEAIRRFIDVSGVEASEAALRQTIKALNASRDTAVTRIQENRDSIRHFWAEAGKPAGGALEWAEKEAKRDPRAFDGEIRDLERLRECHARFQESVSSVAGASELLRAAGEALTTARASLHAATQKVAADAGSVIALLEAAKDHLAKHPAPAECPLCEGTDRVGDLAGRVDERLLAFQTLRDAKARAQTASQRVLKAEQDLQSARVGAEAHAEKLRACLDSRAGSVDFDLPSDPLPADAEDWTVWLAGTSHLPDRWRAAGTEREDAKKFVGTLKRALATHAENLAIEKEMGALIPHLQRTLEIVAEERRTFTDDILKEIASEVGTLYDVVHPGEGLHAITLQLDPEKRSSLEIGVTFGGRSGTPPGAYFSDSHLDTLGLCVFVALAARDRPGETILVLDDVVGSVDEPHVDRLIEMLYDVAKKFRHCVMTTHYGPWRHKFRWGWLKNGQCQFVELTKWSLTKGLTITHSVPDLERLDKLLADSVPDPQLIVAKAGVILEAALDFLTVHYNCSAPRKHGGDYTLGELLPAVDGKLRSALRVEVAHVDDATGAVSYSDHPLGPFFDGLTRIAQTRNVVGCHFSQISFDLLDSDALEFATLVLELMKLLTDGEAGWPKNGKSGSYWATAGETRRLHPYKKPSK